MVLEVGADLGTVEDGLDAELPQVLRWADSGEQQQVGRSKGSGSQHDPGPAVLGSAGNHADGPAPFKHDPRGARVRNHVEVGPLHRRLEAGVPRAEAPAALLPDLAHPCAGRSEEHTSELQSLMRISYA